MYMNRYKITLEQIGGDGDVQRSAGFGFENHDDVFRIIGKMNESGLFADEAEAMRFGVGLKLFASVMMCHRQEPLFSDFEPAFVGFMKKLKGGIAGR